MKIRFLIVTGILIAGLLSVGGVLAQSDSATPEATPVAAEPAASPVAESIRVITLVMWYQNAPSGEFVEVGPVATNNQLIAGPGDPTSAITGVINFTSPENDGLPRITIGDSIFDAFAPLGDPDQVYRWTYLDGDAQLRPAILVLQVEATEGPYKGAIGTATFSSRSDPGSGVLVIMINPATS
jgi:hypothetical protein